MPSPFPGMNPYLERRAKWASFHHQIISTSLELLAIQLNENYVIEVEQRVYIHEPSALERELRIADVGVSSLKRPGSGASTATINAPSLITLPDAVTTEYVPFLTIRDVDDNEVVTVIEILSPTNKYSGPDRDQYIAKRRELFRSHSHFVEIDLLRGGPRMPPEDQIPTCDYCAIVSRASDRPQAGVWPWRLRDAMPELPIPLHPADSDIVLDLKAALDLVYDRGQYYRNLYVRAPEPQLARDDAAWAAQFVPTPTV